MSRTRRLIHGVGLTYVNMGVTTLVGLWLTRFILHTVGQRDYGLWLLVIQVTLYLGVLDLGVIGLLPRDVALIAAREQTEGRAGALAAHVGATLRLVLWQVPLVALAAAALLRFVPAAWAGARQPMVLILAVFVVAFPLRAFPGVLTGLQDLTFLGVSQLVNFAVSTTVTVVLLLAGAGLYGLVAGWMVQQFVPAVLGWARLRRRFPGTIPARLPRLPWREARALLGRSLWVSLGNVAHLFVNASDVIVIGALLGPAAVVPYVITGKLMSVLSNVPISIATSSSPALSDLLVRESPSRVQNALAVLTQTVVIVSGAVACGVLAVNQEFVRLWVGADQFDGMRLTAAIVGAAVMRHWILTLGLAAFSFGYERRLGIISAVEAVTTPALMVALVRWLGPVGAPLASLATALVVAAPATAGAVARAGRTRVPALLATLTPWAWRVAALAAVAAIGLRAWAARGPVMMVAAGSAAVSLYAVVMLPLALRPPLRAYLERFRPGWLGTATAQQQRSSAAP